MMSDNDNNDPFDDYPSDDGLWDDLPVNEQSDQQADAYDSVDGDDDSAYEPESGEEDLDDAELAAAIAGVSAYVAKPPIGRVSTASRITDDMLGESTDLGDNTRAGRARERQARRKNVPMAARLSGNTRGTVRAPRALPSIDLSGIRLPSSGRSLLVLGGALVLVVLVVVILGRIRNNPVEARPNAIWLGPEWTTEPTTPDQISNLAARMRQAQIGTVYAWVSFLQPNDTWSGTGNLGRVAEFVTAFHAEYPEANLYAWLSIPVADEALGISYRLGSLNVRQQVAEYARRMVTELEFDGVFLNAQPVANNDDNFLALLRDVRQMVGTETRLSLGVPPDWTPSASGVPVSTLFAPNTQWERGYKQNVALLVNEMVVMAFNSGLNTPLDYEQWMAHQATTFIAALSDIGEGTELVIGVPSYDAEPPQHDPYVENVLSGVDGVLQGLADVGPANAGFLRGLALYGEWTTTDDEWQAFVDAWVTR
ncbi:MAG: glycoside hydrolase family 18 protein [Pleurocapsa minor GSE-CHR-MK-17-07R]|jgi:hypothetical protein|nr:glycoside hydrolase family 18 protein [Pleurocapsa minor GSE-CHR-MK 17-07R]